MTTDERIIHTAVKSWKIVVERLNSIVESADDAKLQLEVAPGRNRVQYLIGHLTAVNDRLFPLLGAGERLHPELDEAYVNNPDRSLPDPVSSAELRKAWREVHLRLTAVFEGFTPAEWLQRHTAVSEKDFAKDPSRNRLAVLLSRTNHVSVHAGQIQLAG